MRIQPLTTRAQLLATTVAATTIALLVACAGVAIYGYRQLEDQVRGNLEVAEAVTDYSVRPALQFRDPAAARESLAALRAQPLVSEARLYGAAGAPFASYLRTGAAATLPARAPAQPGVVPVGDQLWATRRIQGEGENLGTLLVARDLDDLRSLAGGALIWTAVSFLVSAVAGLVLSAPLLERIGRPIRDLAGAAEHVTRTKDYSTRAPGAGPSELGQLIEAFNLMLAEIQVRDADLRSRTDELTRTQDEVNRLNAGLEQNVADRTAELQAANKELEAFSYSVSHDLRAPLRSIDGFSRILEEDHAATLSPDAQDLLKEVRTSAREMGRLVDDLLAFAKLGRQPLNARRVSLTQLAKDCAQSVTVDETGRDIRLTVADLPECLADPTLMKQVFVNLLSNAVKYSRKVPVAVIDVRSRTEGDEVVFTVEDNGAGFDPRYAHKLFGVFQRLHRAEEFEGTGVGLAIVQRIVARHGGRVWAESQVGKGARFHFTLRGAAS